MGQIRVVNSTSAGEGTRIVCITRCLSNELPVLNDNEKYSASPFDVSKPQSKKQKIGPSSSKTSECFENRQAQLERSHSSTHVKTREFPTNLKTKSKKKGI